ncbi:UNVERIFIED_CONTAM: hypothetical protein RMT77_011346 [Armadillidium vulgare]
MFSGSLKFILISVCISVNSGSQFLELNHDLGPDTPAFPYDFTSHFDIQFLEADSSKGYWIAQNNYRFADLIGTAVTAPYRYDPNGRTVDEIPFDDLFAQAAVIDVRDKVAKNYLYEVTAADVDNWVNKYGNFPPKTVVIFNTGWDEGRWPNQIAYFGTDKNLESMRYPAVSLEAVQALLEYEKSQGIRIVGMGIDTPLIESGPAAYDNFPLIHLVAEADKYIINNLRDVKRLPPVGARLMTMPLKARNGTASPARVAARLPHNYY